MSPLGQTFRELSLKKGHDFSPANKANQVNYALQPAEKKSQYLKMTGLVKGHGFSRADKANHINRALAPAKAGAQEIAPNYANSTAVFSNTSSRSSAGNASTRRPPRAARSSVRG
jgi:hypothetical protein